MNKKQIEALIDSKIAGQGTMVDVGGVLPQILKGILEIAVAGGNVQSDWDESDAEDPAYIKNKPTIVPQEQANWNETDEESPSFIQNKPDVGYHRLKILTSENQVGLSDEQMLAYLELDFEPMTDIQQLWGINPANTFVAPPDTLIPIAITSADIRPDEQVFTLYAYCNIEGEYIDFAIIEYHRAGSGWQQVGWSIKVGNGE